MAAGELPPAEVGWQKLRRQHRTANFSPVIRIRRNGQIGVSADFVRKANIAECTHATLFLDTVGHRIGFEFHSEGNDPDAFLLAQDGGAAGSARGNKHNRVLNVRAILRQSPMLVALMKEDGRARQFEPKKAVDGKWVIHFAPCFELTLLSPGDVGAEITGIYRYKLGNEVIYIGRGNLRSRFASQDRAVWEFDRIEYSVLNNDVAERHWESFWLNDYRQRHNRWPIHNRVAGVATRA